jgi:hypothetical protein
MSNILSESGLSAEEQNQSMVNALRLALQETRNAFDGVVSPDTPVNLERAKRAARRLSENTGVNITYEQLVKVVLREAGSEE